MTQVPDPAAAPADVRPAPRSGLRRAGWLCLKGGGVGLVLFIVAGLTAYVAWRHAAGQLPVEWVRDRLVSVIENATGGRANVALSTASVRQTDNGPKLVLTGFALRDQAGATMVGAPRAEIGFDLWTLIFGTGAMRQIELHDVEVRLTLDRGGRLAFSSTQPTGERASGATDWKGALTSLSDALSGKTGIAGLDSIALRDGRLVIDDATTGGELRYSGIAIDVAPAAGGRRLSIRARGPSGEISLSAAPDDAKPDTINIDWAGLQLADLGVLMRAPMQGVDGGLALAGRMSIRRSATEIAQNVALDLRSGGGATLIAPGTDFATLLSELAVKGNWSAETRVATIERIGLETGQVKGEIAGQVATPASGAWDFTLASGKGSVRSARDGARRFAFDRVAARASWLPDGAFNVPSWSVAGDGFEFHGDGRYAGEGPGAVSTLSLDAANMDSGVAISFWPTFAAPKAREYLVGRIERGRLDRLALRLRFDAAAMAALRGTDPMPKESISLDVAMSQARYVPSPDFPALDIDSARGRLDGARMEVTAPTVSVETPAKTKVTASEGRFTSEYASGPGPSRVEMRIRGSAEAAFDLTDTPLVKRLTDVGDVLDVGKGAADLRLALNFAINTPLRIEDVGIAINGTISGATIDGAVPNESLTDVRAAISYDRGDVAIKGDGRMSGAPATIDVKRAASGAGDATLTLTTDDASRQKRGLPSAPALAGPVIVKMTRSLAKSAPAKVEVDLTRAAISNLAPGWMKPAGRPGRVSFSYAPSLKNNDVEFQDFQADSQGFLLRGVITVGANNAIKTARFAQVRLSPGDDARLDWERSASGAKLTIRGANIDARPLLRAIYDPPRDAPPDAGDIEIDLKSAILTGYNSEAATNVELRAAKRGGELRQFQLSGRFGRSDVRAALARRPDGGPSRLLLESGDAGAFMRFIDLYRRMIGGKLNIDLAVSESRQDGQLVVKDFNLRNEPALRQSASGAAPATTTDTSGLSRGAAPAAARGDVEFEKVRVDFVRTAGRIDVKNGVMWGPVLGVEFEGIIDAPRDRVDVTGTYVPAYALNNAFAQVPVVGMILGGGQYGGLFGVNFKVSGSFAQPSVAVNPLSALTPGVFRRFLEFSKQSVEGQAGQRPPAPMNSNQ